MIERDLSSAETFSEPSRPAWMFSLLFHAGLVVLLGLAIRSEQRGAVATASGSIGIVLNTTSADGDLFGGDDEPVPAATYDEPVELPPAVVPPLLPSEAPEQSSGVSTPQEPVPAPNSATVTTATNSGAARTGVGRGGSPAGRGAATVSVFGVAGTGRKFVYLFDRSSSMEGAPLAAAKRQLIASFESLESFHQFHIIFFNTRTQALDLSRGGRPNAFATEQNKQLARNFVGGITADGGTDRLLALHQALAGGPDVIFFLTDADDPISPRELASIAEANGRARATICVIEFGRREAPLPDNFLAELARQNGGQYGYVNTATLSQ